MSGGLAEGKEGWSWGVEGAHFGGSGDAPQRWRTGRWFGSGDWAVVGVEMSDSCAGGYCLGGRIVGVFARGGDEEQNIVDGRGFGGGLFCRGRWASQVRIASQVQWDGQGHQNILESRSQVHAEM